MTLQLAKPVVTAALIDGLNKGEVVVSDVGPTIPGVSPATLQQFLLDLLRAVAAGSLQPDKVAVAIRSSGKQSSAKALGPDLADALWYAWQEVEGDTSGDSKSRLADAAKDALKEQLITKQQLMESGEGEFFEWCGLVVSKELWRKKEIRSHTKHVYQQRKFNLLREESEGYAKLATLLNQRAAGCLTPATLPAVLAEMKALIGYFDLDPNRCFSVVLDAFSQQPENDAFLGLMPAFSHEALGQLLGFHFFRCREDAAAQRPAQAAPRGLYVAAAKAVQAGHTSLEALMAHLAPADEELKTAYSEGAKKMGEGISRIGIISLISAADTAAAPLAPPGLGLRRQPSGAMGGGGGGGAAAADAQQPRAKSGLTASALELAAAPYAAPLTAMAAANQKLLLLAAFLQIGDWEHAQQLMRWLRALGLADFAVFPAVGDALCALIGRELQPVYAAAMAGAGSSGASLALPERLLQLLSSVGQHLYHNVAVLTKLVRVLAAILAANNGVHPVNKQLHEQVLELLTQSVLPALSLVPGNAGLVYEIWRALEQLTYTDRFCLYADVKNGQATSPLLTAAAKLAETEVRRILRRVTAPANKKEAKLTMKPLGRMLAKIMHSAPLAVAEQLIRQVMGMPGMVTSIVESLKYLTPMAFDVMTFAVLRQLASPKKKLKQDGMNLEEWYQWLSAFTGLLCKKHSEVEVVALLQYVVNQLKSSESLDLLVLKEMLTIMTGHQAVFEVGEHQLDALAGSDTLKAEVITQGEHRSSDKSLQRASGRLLAALLRGESPEERLAMPLLVLLLQQRKLIVLQSQSTHLKLIAELYDKCQEVCTQYAEFLQHALSREEYAALLPSMEELAVEYRVDPEFIFLLYRPLIRDVLPPVALGPDHEEEGEIAEGGKEAGKGADGGAAPMEEDGQLEAGEVAASPSAPAAAGGGKAPGAPPPPPASPDAAERWAQLEAQVLAMHGGGAAMDEGGAGAAGAGERPTFRGMTPLLYTTFWALQLYDLEVPAARYESTISQLRTDIRIAQGDIESAKRDAQRGGFGFRGPPPAEAAGLTVDVEQLQKDIERSQAALDKLPGELKAQQANAAGVERRLQREKASWVLEEGRAALPKEFVQFCILPRMLNSPTDALYCARFLKKVHQLDVPHFSLLQTINHVMLEFGFLVRVCTGREATNFGIFLNEVFALVERWRQADVFARECANALTFKLISKKGQKPAAGAAAVTGAGVAPALAATPAVSDLQAAVPSAEAVPAEGTPAAEAPNGAAPAEAAPGDAATVKPAAAPPTAHPPRNVDHREWLNLCHNWQKKLTDDVFSSCLKSRDYMQVKNALMALNRCVKVYPAVKHDASKLVELLQPIRDKDPREDLKILARMYCTALEMQMKDRVRNMVSTREEYAGLPPKKRPARPAASKGGAAAGATSEGKPLGGAEGGKDKIEVTKPGSEKKAAGSGAGAADRAADKAAAGKEDGRPTTDSSKGPPLPPGMGMSGRRGEQPRERAQQQHGQQQAERRREERIGMTHDGPPPGFGSADKLKHAGSTTELRRAGDQAAAGGERERRERERDRERPQQKEPPPPQQQQKEQQHPERGRGGRDERPPRPVGGREGGQKEQAQEREAKEAAKEQERSRAGAALRPEAAPFVPRDGRTSSGARAAEEPAGGAERDAKRARREEPASGAAAGGDRERERAERSGERAERGGERPGSRAPAAASAGGERERERGSKERVPSRDVAGDAAAGVKSERERPASEHRPRAGREDGKPAADASGRGGQRAERDHRERPTSGGAEAGGSRERERQAAADGRKRGEEDARRDAGPASKRKREESPPPAAAERPTSRAAGDVAREHQREQPHSHTEDRERSRHASRDERGGGKEKEGRLEAPRGRRGEAEVPAGDIEDARAAARAAATAGSARHQQRGKEAAREERADGGSPRRHAAAADADEREQLRGSKGPGAAAAAAAATATKEAESEGGDGSSGSEDERSRSRHRKGSKKKETRERKEKRKRKDKKHSKKDRSEEREAGAASAEAPAPAAAAPEEEHGNKRRRHDEAPDVPARLRGRLGGSLLGAALKDIVHEGQHAPERQERHESPGGRQQQQQQQQQAAVPREGPGRNRRGGGREERQVVEELPRREVREVREGREGRRGGRSRR